jgi:hypothetical protein
VEAPERGNVVILDVPVICHNAGVAGPFQLCAVRICLCFEGDVCCPAAGLCVAQLLAAGEFPDSISSRLCQYGFVREATV